MLLKPLHARFQLFSLRHGFIIVERRKPALQEKQIWTNTEGPLRIEYTKNAIEEIRRRADAAFRALPRIGMGAGGALLGERRALTLTIQQALPLPCAHSKGPSFQLTAGERAHCRTLLPAQGVLGWYCSKPRGPLELSPADHELFQELFPGGWKIVLVVQPSLVDDMRAAVFFRAGDGEILRMGERVFEAWNGTGPVETLVEAPAPARRAAIVMAAAEAVTAAPVAEPVAPAKPPVQVPVGPAPAAPAIIAAPAAVVSPAPPAPPSVPVPIQPVEAKREQPTPEQPKPEQAKPEQPKPVQPKPVTPQPVAATQAKPAPPATVVAEKLEKPAPPAPTAFIGRVPFSSYAPDPAVTARNRRIVWVLLGVLLLLIAATGWVSRDYWIPRPELVLTSTARDAGPSGRAAIEIRWNPDAIRGIDRASMFINDGGTLKELPLDRGQMAAGRLVYQPQTERVTATLHAGDIRASVLYAAPK